jgi:hypothetical protein
VSVGAELFILLLIASTTYAAGRVHAKVGYRFGYRFGYRQGYFDGDLASWNRRRREAQTAITAVLSGKQGRPQNETFSLVQQGTTYTSTAATGRHALMD